MRTKDLSNLFKFLNDRRLCCLTKRLVYVLNVNALHFVHQDIADAPSNYQCLRKLPYKNNDDSLRKQLFHLKICLPNFCFKAFSGERITNETALLSR